MGKGRRERYVPITGHTRKHIIRYIDRARSKLCPDSSSYLFANSDGESISKNSIQQFMRWLLAKSSLKGVKFSPHILRHSFATLFLANGGSITDLQVILGHKSITTTLKYAKLQVKDVEKKQLLYYELRIFMSESLILALTFLLGADIIESAIHTDYNSLIRLVGIFLFRLMVTYFVDKDIKTLEQDKVNINKSTVGGKVSVFE